MQMMTSQSMKKVKFHLTYIQFCPVGRKRKSISPQPKDFFVKIKLNVLFLFEEHGKSNTQIISTL